jgi:enoyl-[acyl-carrier protein] reductase I
VTGDIHFVDSGYNIITMPHPAALKNGDETQNGNGDSAKDAAQ